MLKNSGKPSSPYAGSYPQGSILALKEKSVSRTMATENMKNKEMP
jgi:hypothetical protein